LPKNSYAYSVVTAHSRRLVLVELLIFLSLAGGTALLTKPLMGFFNTKTGIIHSKFMEKLEKSLDRPIRYGSMGPSFIRSLEFRMVVIGNEPEPLARVDYLRLEYSLWALICGKGAGAIRNLVLDKPEIYYHDTRDRDILDKFSSSKKTPKPFALPPNCHADIRNGTFLATTGSGSFGVTGVCLDGEIQKKLIRLNGDWNVFSPAPQGLVTSKGSVHGEFARTLKDGALAVNFDSIEGAEFEAGAHAIAVSFLEDKIQLERVQDSFPLKLYAEYSPKKKELSAQFSADKFLLEKMIHFSGSLERMDALTALSLSGGVSLSAAFPDIGNFAAAALNYSFAVAAEHGGSIRAADMPLKGFVFEGEGNGQSLAFSRFFIDANHGTVTYDGNILFKPFLPQGEMRFSGFSLTGESDINGNLVFTREKRGVRAHAPSLSFGSMYLSLFEGEFVFENGGGHYALEFEQPGRGSSRFGARGSFSKAGHDKKPPRTEAVIALDSFYAADMVNMVRPFIAVNASNQADALQKTALTTEVFLRADSNGLSFKTGTFLVNYGGDAFLSASITGSEKQISVSDGKIWKRQSEARFEGSANYSDKNNVGFNVNINAGGASQDFFYAFAGKMLNRKNLSVEGPYGFLLTAWEYEKGSWAGSMNVQYAPLPFRGHRAFVSLNSSIQFRNTDFWNLNLNRFELKDATEQLELIVHGTANQNGFNMDRIYYNDSFGPLDGSAAAVWKGDFSFIDGSFVLNDRRETEILTGGFFYESKKLEYKVAVQSLKLDRFYKSGKNLRVTANLDGAFSGKENYEVNCSLDSLTGRNGENTFFGSANIALDTEQLHISKARFSMAGINMEMPNLFMDHGAGRLEAEMRVGGRKNNRELGTDLSFGVNFSPTKTWFFNKESFSSLSGILDVRYAFIDNIESDEPFTFVFSRISAKDQDSVIRLSGGPEGMVNLEYLETKPQSGVFTLSLSNPSPVQGTFTGSLEGSTIDALATGLYVDMGGLWDVIPVNDQVRFIGGFISGDTRIYGSIFDPEFAGSAWGSGIRLALPYYVPVEIGPGSGPITLEGSDMFFGPVSAPCEEGHGTVSGWLRFNRWVPSFFVDVEVDKSIPFNINASGFMAKGNATGNLKFKMENDETITIEGRVDAVDTEIALDTAELEKGFSEDGSSKKLEVKANVDIYTSRRVEFLWPSASAPLLRAYGETDKEGIKLIGDTTVPKFSLKGTITLRGGEIYNFQRSFLIREGTLKFSDSDSKIDPYISARAEIRDQNEDGPVILAMIVDNIPLRDFRDTVPRFESTPSLSQIEIYGMLGQASSSNDTDGQNLNPLISTAADMLQTMFFRGAEQKIRNVLGLDMLSFRTQLLQNAYYEGIRNRQPDEKAVTIGNYLDNTAVFMGKYVGQDMFVQTMLSLKYDPLQVDYGGVKPELDIGLDFQTPLFDVRWSLTPSNAQNMFISDQSISLVWRWSL
jgi:hypothetical protein